METPAGIRVRGFGVVNRGRENETDRVKERKKGERGRGKKLRVTHTHTLVERLAAPSGVTNLNGAISVPRLPARVFWLSSPNDLAARIFSVRNVGRAPLHEQGGARSDYDRISLRKVFAAELTPPRGRTVPAEVSETDSLPNIGRTVLCGLNNLIFSYRTTFIRGSVREVYVWDLCTLHGATSMWFNFSAKNSLWEKFKIISR